MRKKTSAIPNIFVLFAVMPQETASFFHVGTVLPVSHVEQGKQIPTLLLNIIHFNFLNQPILWFYEL